MATVPAPRVTAVRDAVYSYWTHIDGGGAWSRDGVTTLLEAIWAALDPHAPTSRVKDALDSLDTY
jgi:sarcosine oxidase delta subunit